MRSGGVQEETSAVAKIGPSGRFPCGTVEQGAAPGDAIAELLVGH
jgi:hypothetical protein